MADPKLRMVKMRLPDGKRVSEKSIWNTSLGGVFIEMASPLTFGAEVQLEFVFGRDQGNITCDGFIVWSTPTSPEKAPGKAGCGVRLMNIGIAEMRRLAEAVAQRL